MPTRTRKRKASEEEDATPDIAPVAKKTSRAPPKSQKKSQEQPPKAASSSRKGRAGTSLSASNAAKKAKTGTSSVSSAKRDIRRKADDLIRLIESQYGSARSTDRPDSTDSSIVAILKDAADLASNSADVNQSAIDEYEDINKRSIDITKPADRRQWHQDAIDIANVEKKAIEMSLQVLNGVVLAGEYAKFLCSPARVGDEFEQAACRWLQGGMPAAEDTWGATARETMKAFAGITKLLL
ncbi:hypothetical protein TARUN_6573 [Trichoderma arundinaceum]|uniref:Uncharacterized protein n=1 Tax=Trichoderma arundinaceum TaxID=490622 RepID=A0A395NI15_TRIAR|nr:hypothetical protein TARUN_6573 [Trichoderma arundinaceum]